MNKGIIKFYNDDKGFGFIKDSESTAEYFFHVKNCKSRVSSENKGMEVSFDLEEGRKGINAVNVAFI